MGVPEEDIEDAAGSGMEVVIRGIDAEELGDSMEIRHFAEVSGSTIL